MKAAPSLLACLVIFAPACGAEVLPPQGQLLVYVSTDAPLPAAPGERLGNDDAPPLFDRIRLEILRPDESSPCAGCKREFDVDRAFVSAGRASFGFVPPIGKTGYRARARMFRAAWREGLDPYPDSTVDATVMLPPAEPDRVIEVTIVLRTEDVAQPKGTDAPLSATLGPPQPDLVGSWAPARRIWCHGNPRPGEVCIPGGAYWMGTTRAFENSFDETVTRQRLVILSPFFMATHEVTIEEMRASGIAAARDPVTIQMDSSCHYSIEPGHYDRRPVTCVSWEKAREYCKAQGGDIPTEAQFEYVAGALTSRAYPWGDDEPRCNEAVFGHTININGRTIAGQCNVLGGALEPGSGKRDRLLLPHATEEILDLGGNAAEWARDLWCQRATTDYWSTGVFRDPLCEQVSSDKSDAAFKPARGGNFSQSSLAMHAVARSPYSGFLPVVGFRCVRSD